MGVAGFQVTETDGRARRGQIRLGFGSIETPVFMPVGTNGTVKAIDPRRLADLGFGLILANTYHLSLRPGGERIAAAGGLTGFTGWGGGFLTDSGGYQVFSLSNLRSITDEGVRFRSHLDGSEVFLSPERVIDLQVQFGSEIAMPLDECTAPDEPREKALQAVERTTRWAIRSAGHLSSVAPQTGRSTSLFGIVQGNFFHDLRRRSALELAELDLPGYAVGGLSVGEEPERYREFLDSTVDLLPANRPRYVMGIGTPDYIVDAVAAGADMFDCVYPTRLARNASILTSTGRLNLRNSRFFDDDGPLDPALRHSFTDGFSRSYLRHLFGAKEILAPMIATFHNLLFMADLTRRIRAAISAGSFSELRREVHDYYGT